MEIEHTFVIKAKRKIYNDLFNGTPSQQVYNFLRDNGFYDVKIEEE